MNHSFFLTIAIDKGIKKYIVCLFSNETKDEGITKKPKEGNQIQKKNHTWKSMFWHLFVQNLNLGVDKFSFNLHLKKYYK